MAGDMVTRALLTEVVYQEVGLSRNESANVSSAPKADLPVRFLSRKEIICHRGLAQKRKQASGLT
jgi:hypothetical protein